MGNFKNEITVIKTGDGSNTLFHARLNEPYHSMKGARSESEHVFIKHGFLKRSLAEVRVLEIGLGTGMNAALTSAEAQRSGITTLYTAIEPYPLPDELIRGVARDFDHHMEKRMMDIQNAVWEAPVSLNACFTLVKTRMLAEQLPPSGIYDVVYMDAFAPDVQPELWKADYFSCLYSLMAPGGIMTTYCAKGQVRRNMREAGFMVSALPGAPGKREMTLAEKPL